MKNAVAEVVLARTSELGFHPQVAKYFGKTSAKDYETLKADIARQGILDPLDVTPPDSEGLWANLIVDGGTRFRIARELGLELVPIRVRPELKTFADQMVFANGKAKRKTRTDRERADQEHVVSRAILHSSLAWKEQHGFIGVRNNEAVALTLGEDVGGVKRRKKVFYGVTSTAPLRDAVEEGFIALSTAEQILLDAERQHGAGSAAARRAVNREVDCRRQEGKANETRHRRAPRTPTFDAKKEEAKVFWAEIQSRIFGWAAAEAGVERLTSADLRSIAFDQLVREFQTDVHCAVSELRRRIRRLAEGPLNLGSKPDAYRELNKNLEVLGVPPLRRGQLLDVQVVKKAHRARVRQTHPDMTRNPDLNKRFYEYQQAFERVMDLAPSL